MHTNPTPQEYLTAIEENAAMAVRIVQTARQRGFMDSTQSWQVKHHLTAANAAATSLDYELRGGKPPKIG